LPSYNVIAADTLHDLTFDLFTLVSGHTWRVTWSTPPLSLKILRLYVLELWVQTRPTGYHWQCVCSHCACTIRRDLCVGGKLFPHIWNPWPRFASLLYNFYGATIKTNGIIHQNIALCACAETAIYELPVKILTSPFDSLTPISLWGTIFQRFEDVFCWFLHWISWMSAIFLLPFYLTYWPRKWVTWCAPHNESFCQVWSWYDHSLPS